MTVVLEWDGKSISGTINPGPNAARVRAVRIDPAMWSVHIEAEGASRVVVDGGIANLGSASRKLTGTWTEGEARSPITLTRVDSMSASSNSGSLPADPTYDRSRRVFLTGTVTNFEWINPHARFSLLVRGEPLVPERWTVEIDSAVGLERKGWKPATVRPGEVIRASGFRGSGNDRYRLLAASVQTEDGRLLFTTPAPRLGTAPQPAPRWPDGRVRLGPAPAAKGYWSSATTGTTPEKTALAFALPWAKAVLDYRIRTQFKDDPASRCVPPGGPRQFFGPQGFQFVEQRDLGRILVLLGDGDRNWRIIYTDGRPQGSPADVVSSYYGSSVGRWDRDTLVVDSVGYNEKFWFLGGGLPHTEALHLTERFTRTDLSTLKYEVTVDDPRTYTRTWKANWTMRWVANQEIQEFFCEEKTS